MSVYFTATLIAGVLKAECVTNRTATKTVTKYDENTGVPYDKEILEDEGLFFGNIRISEKHSIQSMGFSVVEGYDYSVDVDSVIGIKVCATSDLNYAQDPYEITLTSIAQALKDAEEKLKEHGIDVEPKIYLVDSAS